MKAVLNIVAAVLIAAGLVVAVASVLTPGQVILGIDFKLAATLVVGGLILHALASALTLLERMSNDLRQLRRAGSEEPPWLRQSSAEAAGQPATQSAAAMAMAKGVPASAEAIGQETATEPAEPAEPAEEVGQGIGEQPTAAAEAQWPEADEAVGEPEPHVPEPAAHGEEPEPPLTEAPAPEPEPEFEPEPEPEPELEPDRTAEPASEAVTDEAEVAGEPEPAEAAEEYAEEPGEPEPLDAAREDQAEAASEPEPSESAAGDQAEAASGPEPSGAAVEDQAERPVEPETAETTHEDRGEVASKLKPSRDAVSSAEESTDVFAEPAQASQFREEAPEEHPALYVVEERVFRGKQARVLSDGTIEAETAEGWMRFEDFDHLEEYLDAMAEMGR